MTDFFALLGEPRRPFVDPERVKDTFHRLSRSEHPDQTTGGADADARFSALNQAQQTLRDHKARLRHLLALEHPEIQTSGPAPVPAGLADQFAPVHELLRRLDAFLPRKAAASGALARALLAREEGDLRAESRECLAHLENQHAAALLDLRGFDALWNPRPDDAAVRLLDFHGRFAYLSRWIAQLRERLFQLDL